MDSEIVEDDAFSKFQDGLKVTVIPSSSLLNPSTLKFLQDSVQPIRRLPGFRKGHSVPAFPSTATAPFIGKLVAEHLREEFQSLHQLLRTAFGLKRKQIDVTIDEFGFAVIESDLLRFQKSYTPVHDEPESVRVETCLDALPDLNVLSHPVFDESFPYRFERLEVSPDIQLDVELLIDRLEELEPDSPEFKLNYNFDATECELWIPGHFSRFVFTSSQVKVLSNRQATSPQLIKDFADYQSLLAQVM